MLFTTPVSEPRWDTKLNDYSDNDRFQFWLMEMDAAIEQFIDSAPPSIKARLDFSDESLDALEEWVLARYSDPSETRSAQESTFLDGAARYFGEIFRRHTGSKWGIRYDDPKYVFHGLPILSRDDKLGGIPCCPLTTVTAATDRRTGHFFSTILNNFRSQAVPPN